MKPDFMERLARTKGDPSAFSEIVFGSPLHAGQRRFASNATADTNFLLPGNSWGKTEYIARKLTYDCWFKDGPHSPTNWADWLAQEYKALVCSYNYTIAEESFDRLVNHLKNREELRALVAKKTSAEGSASITFTNGSVCDWGSLHGEGRLVEAARRRVIYVDEAGHIPDLSTTFDSILYPRTLGVGGRIHLLGTPKPHSDPYLLEVYEKGKDGKDPFYYSQSGSVFENEFWPPEEKERALRNPRMVKGWEEGKCPSPPKCDDPFCRDGLHPMLTGAGRQVLRGEFVMAGGLFFNRFHIARMFSGDFPDVEWHGDTHFHEKPIAGHNYLGAFDLAGNRIRKKKNKGSDATVGMVIDYTERPWRTVRYDYIEAGEADWQGKYELMAEVFHSYPMPYLVIDSTGNVDSVSEALYDRGVDVEGCHFGGSSGKKFDMLRNLQLVMELEWGNSKGVLRSPLIPKLKHELEHYVLPDDDIEQDCVMTLAMLGHYIAQWELPGALTGEVF